MKEKAIPDGSSLEKVEADARPIEEKVLASLDKASAHRIVWGLAWPVIALNSLQLLNNLLDAKFIGSLGKDALSASGAAFGLVFLMSSVAIAIGTATTALVSRFYGAREDLNLFHSSRQCISLSLCLGVLLAIVGWISSPLLASLFIKDTGSPAYHQLLEYLGPLWLGIPPMYVVFTIASALRGVGDTKCPMYVSGFQILLHIFLNYLLIFPSRDVSLFGMSFRIPGADWGIAGAGWGFTISAWVAAVLYFPASRTTPLGEIWRLEMIRVDWLKRIYRIAAPAGIAALIRVLSLNFFSLALSRTVEGPAALGALRVGFAMEGIAFMPTFGYMAAASALVGQSLGRKDEERAEKLAWSATQQAAVVMVVMSLFFILFAQPLASFFVKDPLQLKLSTEYLIIIALTEPFFGYTMVLAGAHQGAGDTARPAWIAFVSLWLLRVPAAWMFAVWMGLGTVAAWWVMSITQGIQGILMIISFKQGKWKKKEV